MRRTILGRSTLRRGTEGQSLVEFALVLPIFLLIVLAIVDGGRAIFAYNGSSQAARNVARVASVNCFSPTDAFAPCDQASDPAIASAIAAQQVSLVGPPTWTVTCVDSSGNVPTPVCAIGDYVKVTVTSTFALITPGVSLAFGTVGVSSTSTQQIIQ
jgi:Flp pilus assembly protein TadG